MAQKQFYCPACIKKKSPSEKGILLHFRQALTGWDPIWDLRQPHTRWARNKGIEVTDDGYTFEFEKLNDILRKELSSQK